MTYSDHFASSVPVSVVIGTATRQTTRLPSDYTLVPGVLVNRYYEEELTHGSQVPQLG